MNDGIGKTKLIRKNNILEYYEEEDAKLGEEDFMRVLEEDYQKMILAINKKYDNELEDIKEDVDFSKFFFNSQMTKEVLVLNFLNN